MQQVDSEAIVLRRAARGQDLWAAIEAAQYARLMEHEPPSSDAEADLIQAMIEDFSDYAERWDELSAADQALALGQLGHRLVALEQEGLFLHWAVTHRRIESPEGGWADLPLAILAITRNAQPSITIRVPGTLDVD